MLRPLSRSAFRRDLHDGRGNAFRHILAYGDDGVEDLLLDACLHDRRYERQTDPERCAWLVRMIGSTGRFQHYHAAVLAGLDADAYSAPSRWPDDHVVHRVRVALALAQRDAGAARQALRAAFERDPLGRWDVQGAALVELDRWDGLRYVASVVGATEGEPARADGELLIFSAQDPDAGNQVQLWQRLVELAETDHAIRRYTELFPFDTAQWDADRPAAPPSPRAHPWTAEYVLSLVESEDRDEPGGLPYYGKRMSEEMRDLCFARLLAETRPRQLAQYLWLFWQREVPCLHPRLLALAWSPERRLQHAAIRALAANRDPAIHDLAVGLLRERGRRAVAVAALELLIRNGLPGDEAVIAPSLPAWAPAWLRHDGASQIRAIAEAHPRVPLAEALVWAACVTPCSFCRYLTVRLLVERGWATRELLETCLLDSNDETRRLARDALGVPPTH